MTKLILKGHQSAKPQPGKPLVVPCAAHLGRLAALPAAVHRLHPSPGHPRSGLAAALLEAAMQGLQREQSRSHSFCMRHPQNSCCHAHEAASRSLACAGNHEIEQQSVVTKFFNAYSVRLKNAHAASSSPSFHFYSVSNLTPLPVFLTACN